MDGWIFIRPPNSSLRNCATSGSLVVIQVFGLSDATIHVLSDSAYRSPHPLHNKAEVELFDIGLNARLVGLIHLVTLVAVRACLNRYNCRRSIVDPLDMQ